MPFVNTYWFLLSVEILIYFQASYVLATESPRVSYDGAQVWRIILRNDDDIQLFKDLVDRQDVHVWSISHTHADFLVRAEDKLKVFNQLAERNMNHTVLVFDVQKRIDTLSLATPIWSETSLRVGHRLDWRKYPTLNIVEEYYNFLADDYSSICKVHTIGTTAENRSIKMINITNGNPNNKVILLTAGLHGREWISVSSALYILNTIVTMFDQQSSYIQNTNWLIIPVMNPDGYEYTHTSDRLWQKNRRKFKHCAGVDVNRNFETDWEASGVYENRECKGSYSGPSPFSEAESNALRNVILSLNSSLTALLDLHAYGNLILFPWSAKTHATRDWKMHKSTAEEISKVIFKSNKENYTFAATYKVYPVPGTLHDWAYSKGVKHSYVIASRDKGEFGFLLPANEIEDTGKELYSAVRYLAKAIEKSKSKRSGDGQTWF